MPPLSSASIIVGVVVLIVLLLAVFLLGSRFGSRLDLKRIVRTVQTEQPDRSVLLRQGRPLQATITHVRSAFGGTYVTTATATDHTTGHKNTYTQRGAKALGHQGDSITILVDPTHPNEYLMVRSIG